MPQGDVFAFCISFEYDKRLDNVVDEKPGKFHSDWKTLNIAVQVSKSRETFDRTSFVFCFLETRPILSSCVKLSS